MTSSRSRSTGRRSGRGDRPGLTAPRPHAAPRYATRRPRRTGASRAARSRGRARRPSSRPRCRRRRAGRPAGDRRRGSGRPLHPRHRAARARRREGRRLLLRPGRHETDRVRRDVRIGRDRDRRVVVDSHVLTAALVEGEDAEPELSPTHGPAPVYSTYCVSPTAAVSSGMSRGPGRESAASSLPTCSSAPQPAIAGATAAGIPTCLLTCTMAAQKQPP